MQIESLTEIVGVRAGDEIRYRNFVSSKGPDEATSVAFEITLPGEVEFISFSHSSGYSCSAPAVGASGSVRCVRSTLRRFVGTEISVVVRVPVTLATGSLMRATTSVTAAEVDPDPVNNTASALNLVITGTEVADLEIHASGSPDPAAPGGLVAYAVSVTNRGPDTATGLYVSGRVLTGTDLVTPAIPPPDWRCFYTFPFGGVPPPGDGTSVHCYGPILRVGETARFSVVFRMSPFARSDVEFLAYAAGETRDSVPSNNSTVAVTRIGLGEGMGVNALNPAVLALLALLIALMGAQAVSRRE